MTTMNKADTTRALCGAWEWYLDVYLRDSKLSDETVALLRAAFIGGWIAHEGYQTRNEAKA